MKSSFHLCSKSPFFYQPADIWWNFCRQFIKIWQNLSVFSANIRYWTNHGIHPILTFAGCFMSCSSWLWWWPCFGSKNYGRKKLYSAGPNTISYSSLMNLWMGYCKNVTRWLFWCWAIASTCHYVKLPFCQPHFRGPNTFLIAAYNFIVTLSKSYPLTYLSYNCLT